MIDKEGYRSNVGIILLNKEGEVFWARRHQQQSWQFPQGGMQLGEKPEESMYRELREEIGLKPEHVKIVSQTHSWLRYDLPPQYVRRHAKPLCIGQKQKWFLLSLVGDESHIKFDCSDAQEFDDWQWVTYWYPVDQVIDFKREVYVRALKELLPAASRYLTQNQIDVPQKRRRPRRRRRRK